MASNKDQAKMDDLPDYYVDDLISFNKGSLPYEGITKPFTGVITKVNNFTFQIDVNDFDPIDAKEMENLLYRMIIKKADTELLERRGHPDIDPDAEDAEDIEK